MSIPEAPYGRVKMDHLTLFELGRVINNAPKFHNFSYFYMTYLKSKKEIWFFSVILIFSRRWRWTLIVEIILSFNPIRAGGLNQHALFSDGYFSMKKGVWRSKIWWLFLIHYELSENKKWVFTVFLGDLEGASWFSPPPS